MINYMNFNSSLLTNNFDIKYAILFSHSKDFNTFLIFSLEIQQLFLVLMYFSLLLKAFFNLSYLPYLSSDNITFQFFLNRGLLRRRHFFYQYPFISSNNLASISELLGLNFLKEPSSVISKYSIHLQKILKLFLKFSSFLGNFYFTKSTSFWSGS